MGETEISWTHRPGTVGRTWNPTQGCSRKSTGCENCYAEKMASRFAEKGWSKGLINLRTGKWNGVVRLAQHKLAEPPSWRKPSTVFVNSMSDLFHEGFTNEEIAAVFGVMAACPQHTFQILTKRAKRMREWFEWISREDNFSPNATMHVEAGPHLDDDDDDTLAERILDADWPLPNVWIGVSAENQGTMDERYPEIMKCPAVVRMFSCEPLLGLVDLEYMFADAACRQGGLWVVAGCESGHGSRPCSVGWLRSLRDQCERAGVPFYLKQAVETGDSRWMGGVLGTSVMAGVGSRRKKGDVIEAPYLDGRQHIAFPG